jgi:hypothetical protein
MSFIEANNLAILWGRNRTAACISGMRYQKKGRKLAFSSQDVDQPATVTLPYNEKPKLCEHELVSKASRTWTPKRKECTSTQICIVSDCCNNANSVDEMNHCTPQPFASVRQSDCVLCIPCLEHLARAEAL